MKKLLCVGVALTLLSACTFYETDLDDAAVERAKKRAEIRNQIGCQFTDDHDAYRRCVLSTYEHNKPKTFMTSQDCSGQPVAVVSSGATKGTVYATLPTEETISSSTPASPAGCACQTQGIYVTDTTPNIVVTETAPCMVATETKTVTTPVTVEPVATEPVTVKPIVAKVAPCNVKAPKTVVIERKPVVIPQPKVVAVEESEVVMPQPKIVTVKQTETVVEKPLEVVAAPQPLPDKTWWETYQEGKEPEKPVVVCPCLDPNDPCPQCVTK